MIWKLPALIGTALLLVGAVLVGSGDSLSSLREDARMLCQAEARTRELQELDLKIQERIRLRVEIVDQVVAGRLSLLEAAVRFRSICDLSPDQPLRQLQFLPGDTLEEKLCHQVISWAESHAAQVSAGCAQDVAARLSCELEDARAEGNGLIRLPQ
jgi:hypothetical protein